MNFNLNQGDTFLKILTIKIKNGVVEAPRDLTGFTAKMQIRKNYNDESAIATMEVGSGIVIDAENGKVTLKIEAAVTKDFEQGTYVYDLELVSPAPESITKKYLKGKITVFPEVTK